MVGEPALCACSTSGASTSNRMMRRMVLHRRTACPATRSSGGSSLSDPSAHGRVASPLAPVLVAEAVDLAAVALRRAALLFVDEGGGGHAKLLRELRARGEALGGLLVERGGDGGGAPSLGEGADLDHVLVGPESDGDLVAGL